MKRSSVIAIDGPAASGKSTVASIVAQRLGARYINTGNMYRALTLAAIKRKIDLSKADSDEIAEFLCRTSLDYSTDGTDERIILDGEDVRSDIRSPQVVALVSKMAAIEAVRKWLVEKQRQIAKKSCLAVMEGRDIGTVVFPDAKWKFFLTASPEIRAKRRIEQSGEIAKGATVASVAMEIAERDRMDMSRKVAPLTRAEDAVLIDTSDFSIGQVAEMIIKAVNSEN